MIKAEIIADSVSQDEHRITTFILTYPRFIHSELMTHRVFSRNAASSRAIPFRRMVRMIEENPAGPVRWGSAQPGMQSGEEISVVERAEAIWQGAMFKAIRYAEHLDDLGVHKSISNRLLEPFAHMTTIVTATEWSNFFSLRAHPDAQPEFQVLAYEMLDRYLESVPKLCEYGDWHIPFDDDPSLPFMVRVAIATARCARISYLTHNGDRDTRKDIELHDRLLQSRHMSPFEHCAVVHSGPQGNFIGWKSYRKMIPNEAGSENVNLEVIQQMRPEWTRLNKNGNDAS